MTFIRSRGERDTSDGHSNNLSTSCRSCLLYLFNTCLFLLTFSLFLWLYLPSMLLGVADRSRHPVSTRRPRCSTSRYESGEKYIHRKGQGQGQGWGLGFRHHRLGFCSMSSGVKSNKKVVIVMMLHYTEKLRRCYVNHTFNIAVICDHTYDSVGIEDLFNQDAKPVCCAYVCHQHMLVILHIRILDR